MANVTITLNGQTKTADVSENTLLVDFIRSHARLTGTHVGCDTSQCGACVVHVEGESMKSCTMLAVEADGKNVVTIEGMANEDGSLGILQKAFQDHHGLQCGYCTPGMVMSAADLLNVNSNPSDAEIREWLEGNICRCTGYHNIVKAVQAAAAEMRG
ncbi:MAG: (2Fe-2S)-binding protein [Alphaproteobacteria bacterium]|nr:(2Fe-2S)-binding protein [Alphaproteobacteria bacterium]